MAWPLGPENQFPPLPSLPIQCLPDFCFTGAPPCLTSLPSCGTELSGVPGSVQEPSSFFCAWDSSAFGNTWACHRRAEPTMLLAP